MRLYLNGGASIEVKDVDELREVVRGLGLLDQVAGSSISERLATLLGVLPPTQQRMLEALAQNPDGLTDQGIREALGLEATKRIGGFIMGVSKRARALKLDLKNVMTKTVIRGTDNARAYTYRLTPEMREVITEAKEV